MKIRVVLFGHLARLIPEDRGGRTVLDLADGATVGQALDMLNVPAEARTYLVVDGQRVTPEHPLRDGGELRVVVPLGGG